MNGVCTCPWHEYARAVEDGRTKFRAPLDLGERQPAAYVHACSPELWRCLMRGSLTGCLREESITVRVQV